VSFTIPEVNNKVAGAPEGLYVMELKDLVQEDAASMPNPKYKNSGPRIRWIFTIKRVIDSNDPEAHDQVGEEFWAWSSLAMGRKATMRKWSEALLNRQLSEGEQITPTHLLGKRCKATVSLYMKETGEQGTKITSMLPFVPQARATAQPPPAPTPAAAADDELEDLDF
jgi:hypothetical protein